MKCTAREWLRVTTVLFMARAIPAMVVPNATLLEKLLEKYMDEDGEWWTAKQRGKRAITDNDMQSILDLHNKLRSQVYPTASNMEYMNLIYSFDLTSCPSIDGFTVDSIQQSSLGFGFVFPVPTGASPCNVAPQLLQVSDV
ncbi:hypothetical protein CB1_000850029 [Camelus ferus]|nr:hypothetical protein CB1_000850029 [Camelus ferus]